MALASAKRFVEEGAYVFITGRRQEALDDLLEKTERLLPQMRGVKAIPISGETGEGLDRLMRAIVETHETWNRRISTSKLNQWLERVVTHHPPPAARESSSACSTCAR